MTTLDRPGRVTAVAFAAFAAFAGIALLALVVGTPTASTTGGTGMTGTGMMGGGMMGGSGAFPFVFLFLLLAFAALLALGYVGIRAIAARGESDRIDEVVDGDEEADPIARIQRRYTEGELTEAEFERSLERELGGEETDGGDRGSGDESDVGGASAERSLSGRER